MARIGIMGGTFDPIHLGHLVTAEEARWQLGLDRVIFVPNRHPPHKDPGEVTDPEHRFRMTFLATATNPYFDVSREEIDRPGPSYTVDTLRVFRARFAGVQLFYITGADAIHQILRGEWHRTEELLRLCEFIAASRPGYALNHEDWQNSRIGREYRHRIHVLEIPALAISSTEIRWRVRNGKPIRYLVPEAVEQYIVKHNLYREGEGTA
ncbi:MAG: nicotinate-nucleotide adenylyltransferase [Armatimonadota bacterium]|nr:nicotinate-nucleotide adenylyltransferase [Bacillota bacterium]MDQ7801990.1 nicotinate-nucleotide adenylyltransferase [Armatimonadota bacterium]MDR5676814.1 nicotinate-nucleotide adenylyltransferase [Armatimonadota bacterium]MDR5688883.1 nicotinate-nucleotide adenylyltransferase [Armatimonadota bacterium]MDR7390430.1 nicotinate-nucleotide adenylyltransferase [Armatimonadota bacterium]